MDTPKTANGAAEGQPRLSADRASRAWRSERRPRQDTVPGPALAAHAQRRPAGLASEPGVSIPAAAQRSSRIDVDSENSLRPRLGLLLSLQLNIFLWESARCEVIDGHVRLSSENRADGPCAACLHGVGGRAQRRPARRATHAPAPGPLVVTSDVRKPPQ